LLHHPGSHRLISRHEHIPRGRMLHEVDTREDPTGRSERGRDYQSQAQQDAQWPASHICECMLKRHD
jgi:hypothetical protein